MVTRKHYKKKHTTHDNLIHSPRRIRYSACKRVIKKKTIRKVDPLEDNLFVPGCVQRTEIDLSPCFDDLPPVI